MSCLNYSKNEQDGQNDQYKKQLLLSAQELHERIDSDKLQNTALKMLSILLVFLFLSYNLVQAARIYGPLLDDAFPDPTIIFVDDAYYAFSSRSLGKHTTNIPMATSKMFTHGWKKIKGDALPDPGPWTASKPEVLTPDINQLADGSFIMYYIAIPKDWPEKQHCIGAATAKKVTGPYKPQTTPLLCPEVNVQGAGTADPNGFVFNNSQYLVFKNASGHDPEKQSYIAIEGVQKDGYTPTSRWTDLINSTAADDKDVEGSCLAIDPSTPDNFVLFFTTGTFNTSDLKIQYATASNLLGPYERHGVLLETGIYGQHNITAPVGLDVVPSNVSQAVFEAIGPDHKRSRKMYAVELDYNQTGVGI